MKTNKIKLSDVIDAIRTAGFHADGTYGALDYRMFPSATGTTVCVVPPGSPAEESPLIDFFVDDHGNVRNFEESWSFWSTIRASV
jgi:hypothetical protein